MAEAIKRRLFEAAEEEGDSAEWVVKGAGRGVSSDDEPAV
jgi:hypothetical protein